MKQEEIKMFLHKNVKLVQKPCFVLHGRICKIYENTLIFETTNGISAISLDCIKEIVLVNGDAK